MKRIIKPITMISFLFCVAAGSFGQSVNEPENLRPNVAGQFYPADSSELRKMLAEMFSLALPDQKAGEVLAIISPHAGYIFSGKVAASAFNQADPDKKYKTIFVIGSSHKMSFEGASIYNTGNIITPLGIVNVDTELAGKLIKENPAFVSKPSAFYGEHSIEVQLPFLQYHMAKEFRIVPILFGSQSPSVSRSIAETLLPYFNNENLFVFSSDFSHYPEYETAKEVDRETAMAIISKSPEKFINTLNDHTEKNLPDLLTSACAWPSVLTLLFMTEVTSQAEIHLVDYQNSGDTKYGDHKRVVGYNAMSVVIKGGKQPAAKGDAFTVSEEDKKTLLQLARKSIGYYLENQTMYPASDKGYSKALMTPCGAFVTLNKDGRLRGCIGRMTSTDMPLYNVVSEMAVSAAVNDYRFDKVTASELEDIEIEISILTPLKLIKSIDEIEMGKNGIYIKKGSRSGTFLPQVARETGWSKEDFLGHCARDKAGIGWDGWKDADIYTYEAIVFGEADVH
jgi:MEMO1 family protein